MDTYDVMMDGEPLRVEGRQATVQGFTRKSAKHQAKHRFGDGAAVVPAGTAQEAARLAAEARASEERAAEAANAARQAEATRREAERVHGRDHPSTPAGRPPHANRDRDGGSRQSQERRRPARRAA